MLIPLQSSPKPPSEVPRNPRIPAQDPYLTQPLPAGTIPPSILEFEDTAHYVELQFSKLRFCMWK